MATAASAGAKAAGALADTAKMGDDIAKNIDTIKAFREGLDSGKGLDDLTDISRGFCADCGSPIIFSYETLDAIFVGTLDDPENWKPNGCHLGIESQISWETIHDTLPRYRTEDDPEFIKANSK